LRKIKFYSVISGITLSAYGWLIYNFQQSSLKSEAFSLCIFKNVSGVACPACGTTRSTFELIEGNLMEAALINPLGIVAFIGLLILPVWLLYDLLFKKNSLWHFSNSVNNQLNGSASGYLLALLLLANWGWNIIKGL